MNLNITFLSVLLAVLGLFLFVVSVRLSSVIQSSDLCTKSNSLQNANRGILVVGIILFMSSAGYILCKRNCSGDISVSSMSDMMYLSFNLALGIVIITLFSIVSGELNKCGAPIGKTDSGLVASGLIVGVVLTLVSLGFLGKKLYDNREDASRALNQMKTNAMSKAQNLSNNLKSSSPSRVDYVDPFGLGLDSSPSPKIQYRDPFGYDDL